MIIITVEPAKDYEGLKKQFNALKNMYNRQEERHNIMMKSKDRKWEERLLKDRNDDKELIEHLTNLLEARNEIQTIKSGTYEGSEEMPR